MRNRENERRRNDREGESCTRRTRSESAGGVGSIGRRRDGARATRVSGTRRALGRAWWRPRRADAAPDGKKREGTHPELLERVRLTRNLPEERREIHAVALGLQIGDDPRGLLHVLGGCGIEERGGRAKAASEIGRAGIVRDVFALIPRNATYPNRPPRPARFRIRTRRRHPVSGVKRTSRARSRGASIRA